MGAKFKEWFDELKNIRTVELTLGTKNFLERILWVLLGITGIAWAFYFLPSNFEIWRKNPTIITKANVDISQIKHPAITVTVPGSTKYAIAERLGNYVKPENMPVELKELRSLMFSCALADDISDISDKNDEKKYRRYQDSCTFNGAIFDNEKATCQIIASALSYFKKNNISIDEKYDEFLIDLHDIKDGNHTSYINSLSEGILNSGNITSTYRKYFGYTDFKGSWGKIMKLWDILWKNFEMPDELDWTSQKIGTLIVKSLNLYKFWGNCMKRANEIMENTFRYPGMTNVSLTKIAQIYSLTDFRELTTNNSKSRERYDKRRFPSLINIEAEFVTCFEHVGNSRQNFQNIETRIHFDPRNLHLDRYVMESPCLEKDISEPCQQYCNWHDEIIDRMKKKDLLKIMKFSLPQRKLAMDKQDWEMEMAEEIFGKDKIKETPNEIAPESISMFCFNEGEGYTGDDIGMGTKVCNKFFLTPSDIGIVYSKNIHTKSVLKVDEDYEILLESEKNQKPDNEFINGKVLSRMTLVFDTNAETETEVVQTYPRSPNDDTEPKYIQFQIHQSKDIAKLIMDLNPADFSQPLTLTGGHEYFIDVYPYGQISTEEFKAMSKEQRHCKLENEVEQSDIFKIYTRNNCIYSCHVELASKQCRCRPWDFLGKSEMPECDIFGRSCFLNSIKAQTKSRNDPCQNCSLECDYMKFKMKLRGRGKSTYSTGYFLNINIGTGKNLKNFEDFIMDENRTLIDQGFRNVYDSFRSRGEYYRRVPEKSFNGEWIVVHLEFKEPEIQIISPKYSFFDMVGNFGGQFGLFEQVTGASFLGLINLIIILIKFLIGSRRSM